MDTQLRAAHMPWTALAPVSCMAGAPSRIPTHVSGGGSIPQCRCSGATWAKNRQLYGSPFLLLTRASARFSHNEGAAGHRSRQSLESFCGIQKHTTVRCTFLLDFFEGSYWELVPF